MKKGAEVYSLKRVHISLNRGSLNRVLGVYILFNSEEKKINSHFHERISLFVSSSDQKFEKVLHIWNSERAAVRKREAIFFRFRLPT